MPLIIPNPRKGKEPQIHESAFMVQDWVIKRVYFDLK